MRGSSSGPTSQAAVLGTVVRGVVTVPRGLAISVAVDATGPRGGGRGRRRRRTADSGYSRRGYEKVLHSLTGYLAGAVADERVEKVALVGNLGAVGVVGDREPSGGTRGGRVRGHQWRPERR